MKCSLYEINNLPMGSTMVLFFCCCCFARAVFYLLREKERSGIIFARLDLWQVVVHQWTDNLIQSTKTYL